MFFENKKFFRRKGYGSYLMKYLIKQCKELNVKKILLEEKASSLEADFHTFFEHFIIVFKCILHDRFETVKLVHEFLKRNGLITEGKQ